MKETSFLAARVEALKGAAILCVGDVMLDRFIYGEVDRISPEAPIPVVRISREIAMLGGAGNVVRNLVALGAEAYFVSVVGDDSAGREVTRLIGEQAGVDPCMVVEHNRQTTIKTRYFAASQQLLRADRETTAPMAETSAAQLLRFVEALLDRVAVVVLSDYGKGVLAPDITRRLIAAARTKGKPVIVDPKATDYAIYSGATLLTPNRKELAEATKMPVDSDERIAVAARRLMDGHGIQSVLVTRSQDGMTLVDYNGQHHLPAEAREVFDVSGAGDTVVATLAAAIAAGIPVVEAAKLANSAAGIVVGKVGTAVASAAELSRALKRQETRAGDSKVMDRDAAREAVERWRRKGRRIGFTNGCFDLLHPGHVSLLEQARAQCDVLIVGLNSDASVSRLKGPTRPVNTERARATVLASLASVDAVVVFGEETPMALIGILRPDVLVKGADYTRDAVVGGDFVESYGGRVVLAQLEEGHSTTATIARMAQ